MQVGTLMDRTPDNGSPRTFAGDNRKPDKVTSGEHSGSLSTALELTQSPSLRGGGLLLFCPWWPEWAGHGAATARRHQTCGSCRAPLALGRRDEAEELVAAGPGRPQAVDILAPRSARVGDHQRPRAQVHQAQPEEEEPGQDDETELER